MLRIALSLIAALLASAAAAQFPSRPLTIIVPIPPGGAPDIAARVIADKLSQSIGQPVVVENKTGANGNIANEFVARSQPDGHTLGLLADSQITINPHLYKMPIDTLRDLTPVVTVAANQFVLTVNPSLPVRTFPEFIEYAKARQINYGSAGIASVGHLSGALFVSRNALSAVHIPFRGGGPAMIALLGGQIVSLLGYGALLLFATQLAHAQGFPNRQVTLVVPVAPGGILDTVARMIAPSMSKGLGQPVVVDNKPGASGNIGASLVAKAKWGVGFFDGH